MFLGKKNKNLMNLKTSDKMMDFRTEFKETLNGAVH